MSRLIKRVATRTQAARLTKRMDAIWDRKRNQLEGVVAGRNLVYINGRAFYVPGISPPNQYGPGDPGSPHAPGPQWPNQPVTLEPIIAPYTPSNGIQTYVPAGYIPPAWPGSPGFEYGAPGGGGGTLPPGTGVPPTPSGGVETVATFDTTTPGPTTYTQTFTDLQPGDGFLFCWRYLYETEYGGPPDPADGMILLAQPGDTVTAFDVVASPDDNYWQPYFLNPTSQSYIDPYFCFWMIDGFTAGSYKIMFTGFPALTDNTIAWGKQLRGIDPAVWGYDSEMGALGGPGHTPIKDYDSAGASDTLNPYPSSKDISAYNGGYALLVPRFWTNTDGSGTVDDQEASEYGTKVDEFDDVLQTYVRTLAPTVDTFTVTTIAHTVIALPTPPDAQDLIFTTNYVIFAGAAAP